MSDIKVSIDQLNSAISGILDEYKEHVVSGLKSATESAMNELVETSRATAPVGKRSKHYRNSIAQKTLSENANGVVKVWYVKGSDYRLTHLLNNGHALRDGGRYAGTKFLTKATESVVEKYVKKIEEVVQG